MIDLHCHTIASDGECTPKELVDLALKKNLNTIAITDHDSVGSIKQAAEYSKDKPIEVIPGIELSCDDPLFDFDKIDVIGLFIDYSNKPLIKLIKHINETRNQNKKEIINKLNKLGFEINYEEVKKQAKGTFGRPHIAKHLLKKHPERFTSVNDVFDKYLGQGKPAFVKTTNRVSINKAINIIKGAKGLSFLAHPGIYPKGKSAKLIDYFVFNGGDGIETYYPYHVICPNLCLDAKGNEQLIQFFKEIAKSKNILESGGSDYHGKYRSTLGETNMPDLTLDSIKKKTALL